MLHRATMYILNEQLNVKLSFLETHHNSDFGGRNRMFITTKYLDEQGQPLSFVFDGFFRNLSEAIKLYNQQNKSIQLCPQFIEDEEDNCPSDETLFDKFGDESLK
jgi:hypothetical protein